MTTTFAKEQPKTVDSDKCRFTIGHVKFMDSEAPEADSDDLQHPIRMVARTDQPLYHWWWGNIVHDIDGMTFHKDSIVVDYCHDDRVIMGYLDKHENDGGFVCEGALVRIPGSMAETVIINGQNKVPYEASIFWDPDSGVVVEQVGDGASVRVNGFEFHGPGVVIRECKLSAVAICPHGQDMNAETTFSKTNQSTVSLTYKDAQMPTEKPGKDTPETPTELTAEQKLEQLETKFADLQAKFDASQKGEGETPKDLPTALAKIEELKAKLSADTDTDGDDGREPTEFADQLDAMEKRLEAKFKHAADSDGDSASGDGGENEGDKPSWANQFKFAGSRPANNASA